MTGSDGAQEIKLPISVFFVHPRLPNPQGQLESILKIPRKKEIHILSQASFLLLCKSDCQNSASLRFRTDCPCHGGCPVPCRVFSSTPGLYPLRAGETPPHSCDGPRCLQTLPGVSWAGGRGEGKSPHLRTTAIDSIVTSYGKT